MDEVAKPRNPNWFKLGVSGNPAALFKPGQSGNPGGRPKLLVEVQELARQYTTEAIEGLVEIARNPKASAQARQSAWTHILDRAWGRPHQAVELDIRRTMDEMSDAELLAIVKGADDVKLITSN